MDKLGVVIYGCGVIGRKTAEALFEKESLEIVGAIDAAPDLQGKDLGALLENPRDTGVVIRDDVEALLSRTSARAVVLTTSSHLKTVYPQLVQCAQAGLNVVSTCEELAYPWVRSPALAAKTDELARQHGITVVGTGINPGFLMDTLPIVLTAPCLRVDAVRVTRMMNSARRRIPFQKKVGTGLSPAEFEERIQSGAITGHVGLLESIHLIAAALGWSLAETVEMPPQPVLADKAINTPAGPVQAGQVTGLTSPLTEAATASGSSSWPSTPTPAWRKNTTRSSSRESRASTRKSWAGSTATSAPWR